MIPIKYESGMKVDSNYTLYFPEIETDYIGRTLSITRCKDCPKIHAKIAYTYKAGNKTYYVIEEDICKD